MFCNKSKKFVQEMLSHAGIKIDGSRSFDIQVHNDNFYNRVLREGSLGVGESYMDGWWDVERLDEFFEKVLQANIEKEISYNWRTLLLFLSQVLINPQRKSKAFEISERHYDIGNDLYRAMLDSRMVYTCGYWKNAKDLEEAQEAKLSLVCKKLELQKDMKVLDIGCGWGSFAKYATEKYGVSVVGITVSQKQVKLGRKLCTGLPIEIKLQDYRDIEGVYDRIVSLGMFEHVGYKNYQTYMKIVDKCLKSDGLFLLHTIGTSKSEVFTNPWVAKYIFPNSMLPSIKQIGDAIEGLFVMEDWHNFGFDYSKTLMAWFQNFDMHWKSLKSNYNERFYRMWKFFLLGAATFFRVRKIHLWQIVLSKKGVPGGYSFIR